MRKLTTEQALARFPRLVRAMQRQAILCTSEAGACLRDWSHGFAYSGEAVNNYGGCERVICDAFRRRNASRIVRGTRVAMCGTYGVREFTGEVVDVCGDRIRVLADNSNVAFWSATGEWRRRT